MAYDPQSPNVFPVTGSPNGQLAGIASDGTLPPDMAIDITNGQIYSCLTTGTTLSASWVAPPVYATQIGNLTTTQIGLIASSQIISLSASQIVGLINSTQVASLASTQITGAFTTTQVGIISSTQISSLNATQLVGLLATSQLPSLTTTQIGALSAMNMPAFSGDFTTNSGTTIATLNTVNSNVGVFGNQTQIPQLTLNAKGLVTAATVVNASGGSGGLQSGTDTGTPNHIVVTISGATATLGQTLEVTVLNANTSYTPDLSLNGGPAIPITVNGGRRGWPLMINSRNSTDIFVFTSSGTWDLTTPDYSAPIQSAAWLF